MEIETENTSNHYTRHIEATVRIGVNLIFQKEKSLKTSIRAVDIREPEHLAHIMKEDHPHQENAEPLDGDGAAIEEE